MGAGDPGFAAGPGRVQAQQADDIGAVAMKVLAFVGAVLPHSRRGWQPLIPDVGEHVGVAVLLDGLAEQSAETEVGALDLGIRQPVDGAVRRNRTNPGSHGEQFDPPVGGGAEMFCQFSVFTAPGRTRPGRCDQRSDSRRDHSARSGTLGVHTEGTSTPTTSLTIRSTRPGTPADRLGPGPIRVP